MPESSTEPVFVAENLQLAEAIVGFLENNEIAAEIYTGTTSTVAEPVTGVSEVVSGDQFEIRVTDATQYNKAVELINSAASMAMVQQVREKRLSRTGTVSAKCEECGKSSDWPAAAMGTTENCPHCGAYMDIPDPDDDWSDVDFGKPEDDDEPKTS